MAPRTTARKTAAAKKAAGDGPFGGLSPEEASARARDIARVRAEQAHAEFQGKVALGDALTKRLPREKLADLTFAAAQRIALDVLSGQVPIRNGTEAANAIKALVEVGRLEKGEVTSRDEVLTREERIARLEQLKETVEERKRALAAVPDPDEQQTA